MFLKKPIFVDHPAPISFASDHFESAAALIRGSYDADSDNIGYSQDYILHWLDTMTKCSRNGFGLDSIKQLQALTAGGFGHVYNVEHLIHCLRIAGCLRGDRQLDTVVEETGMLLGFNKGGLK